MEIKVLVIDDSPTICFLLMQVLEEEGCRVATARSAEEGIEKAQQETPDVTVLDTILPDLDGFEVCRRLRQIQKLNKMKIIMVTGTIDAVDAVEAKKAGADDYCVKTNDFSFLVEAVKKAAEGE